MAAKGQVGCSEGLIVSGIQNAAVRDWSISTGQTGSPTLVLGNTICTLRTPTMGHAIGYVAESHWRHVWRIVTATFTGSSDSASEVRK